MIGLIGDAALLHATGGDARAGSPLLVVIANLLTGSLRYSPSLLLQREPREVDDMLSLTLASELAQVAQTGDWLLAGTYTLLGDMIFVLDGGGRRLGHAAIYDGASKTVIEAVPPRVQEVSLLEFAKRNANVTVVRPRGISREHLREAIGRARSMIGAPFDYLGILGLEYPTRFFCTELIQKAYSLPGPRMVWPRALLERGDVRYSKSK